MLYTGSCQGRKGDFFYWLHGLNLYLHYIAANTRGVCTLQRFELPQVHSEEPIKQHTHLIGIFGGRDRKKADEGRVVTAAYRIKGFSEFLTKIKTGSLCFTLSRGSLFDKTCACVSSW